MVRTWTVIAAVLLGVTLSACAVEVDSRRCPYGWEPGHRDRYGRWIPAHCR